MSTMRKFDAKAASEILVEDKNEDGHMQKKPKATYDDWSNIGPAGLFVKL
jgi:hypothetical protein